MASQFDFLLCLAKEIELCWPMCPTWQCFLGKATNSMSAYNKLLCQQKFPHEHAAPCVSSAWTSVLPRLRDLGTHAGFNLTRFLYWSRSFQWALNSMHHWHKLAQFVHLGCAHVCFWELCGYVRGLQSVTWLSICSTAAHNFWRQRSSLWEMLYLTSF